jgi:hypothetical protein
MSARRHLIAALSEDSMGGIATLHDVERAEKLVDAHRAEVLREEMRNLRRIEREDTPEGALGTRTGLLRAALILDERAETAGEKASAPAPTDTPDFLQVGHTYRSPHSGFTAPELIVTFRVEHVTRHPDRGHLRAIGWARTGEPGAGWHGDFLDEEDIDGWVEVTEGGEGQ